MIWLHMLYILADYAYQKSTLNLKYRYKQV